MFRASVGHRHGAAGPLPVAELLQRRRHLAADPPADPARDPTARGGEPILCPEQPDARRTWALATVLLLFTALLCASAAAIAVITTPIAARSGLQPPRVEPIAGSTALRPDLLDRAHWPFDHVPPSATPPSETPPSEPPPSEPPVAGPPASKIRASEPTAPATGPTAVPPTAVVGRFTADLKADPARAVAQLSPELVGDQGPEIAQAWAPAEQLRAEDLAPAGPDAATATITARFPDGKRISLREEFRTAGDRIRSVRLLRASVQH